ncbi:MAG: HNH endonuclease, partial [Acidimicrobiales bacterium]|nr:HNH endonuclease [Acidimicrobiales bacterium]
ADRDLSIAQANHDALVQLVLDPNAEGTVRPNLEILVPADDSDTSTPDSAGAVPVPGDRGFAGVGYPRTSSGNLIPPAIVDCLKPSARVRYHRVTASGSLADDQPAGRHFTTVQRRMIRLRDTRCQHSGCRRPARHCQYDHVVPWSERGPTLIANGQLLCGVHHSYKHRNDPTHHSPLKQLFTDSPLIPKRE